MNAQQAAVVLTRLLGALVVVYAMFSAAESVRVLMSQGWTLAPRLHLADARGLTDITPPGWWWTNLVYLAEPVVVFVLGTAMIVAARPLTRSVLVAPRSAAACPAMQHKEAV
jgi:hypothetical protein